ncbi:MAG: branched-chain amino acid transport system II carrier protein [Candidatus Heteroscillospira sp.]|jgi:LIVCS family branched-chain amino acid:cation transporter
MKGDISAKKLFIMGGALFSMHFGASCMLYPVNWGKESGSAVLIAFLGILITGLLLPMLAYVALSRGGGNFRQITCRFSPRFGSFFCLGTVILLGPLFVVPRMSAASWDAIMQFTGWHTDSKLPIMLFNCAYYALTYWFVSSKSKTMDKIGNILFPVLIVIVSAVIIKGIATPISDTWAEPSYTEPPFIYGFLEGYATADLLCSMLFGLVIVSGLKNAGVPASRQNISVVKVGLVGMGLLSLTHFGHMIVGANTGGTINLSYAQLYTEVVRALWGNVGGIFFSIALVAAALTTAVGLTGSTAEYMEEATGGRCSYKAAAIATCAVSIVISAVGLDSIITLITPLLDAFYPGAIVIVLYYVFMPRFNEKSRLYALAFAFYGATLSGVLDVCAAYCRILGLKAPGFLAFYNMLPWSEHKLTWVFLAVVCYLLGLLLYHAKRRSARAGTPKTIAI